MKLGTLIFGIACIIFGVGLGYLTTNVMSACVWIGVGIILQIFSITIINKYEMEEWKK